MSELILSCLQAVAQTGSTAIPRSRPEMLCPYVVPLALPVLCPVCDVEKETAADASTAVCLHDIHVGQIKAS